LEEEEMMVHVSRDVSAHGYLLINIFVLTWVTRRHLISNTLKQDFDDEQLGYLYSVT
jgi:hypothetical protein